MRNLVKINLLDISIMTLNLEAKKILLRKIPHGLFICGVRDEDKNCLLYTSDAADE